MNVPIGVILQASSSPKILREESLIREQAYLLGVPVREVSMNDLTNLRGGLRVEELPMGSLPFMEAAFKSVKKAIPKMDHYPESLKPWLHRAIWKSSPGAAAIL